MCVNSENNTLSSKEEYWKEFRETLFQIGRFVFEHSQLETSLKILYAAAAGIPEEESDKIMKMDKFKNLCEMLFAIMAEKHPLHPYRAHIETVVKRYDNIHRIYRNTIFHSAWLVGENGPLARYISPKDEKSFPFKTPADLLEPISKIIEDRNSITLLFASFPSKQHQHQS